MQASLPRTPPFLMPAKWVNERVNVAVIGAGGNGAQMLGALARLDIAMRALGHPAGLAVTAYDGASVREANVGRQAFFPCDIGINKAVVAINRINMAYGFRWTAVPSFDWGPLPCDLVISCVDTRRARREIARRLEQRTDAAWLDLGNEESTGQVVLGFREAGVQHLPFVTDLFPELKQEPDHEDNAQSCSLAISLASQGLYINDFVSRIAAHILYRLFSRAALHWHGAMVNLDSLRMTPIAIDEKVWKRFGWSPPGPIGAKAAGQSAA